MIGWLQAERSSWAPWLVQVLLAVLAGGLVGAMVTVSPLLAAGGAGLALAFGLMTLERRLVTLFIWALAVGLVGYMFFGRGFAYAGIQPLFLSEALLGLAVLSLLYSFTWRYFSYLHLLVSLFLAWGLFRTLPYVQEYGLDALRDGVVWGYAVFAIALSMVLTPKMFRAISDGYSKLIPAFVIWVPILAVIALLNIVPYWPTAPVAIAEFKQGDMAVHLAGITAFVVSGAYYSQSGGLRLPGSMFWTLVIVDFAFIAMSRAGLLTVVAGIGAGFFLWPTRQLVSFIAVATIVVSLVVVINPNFSIGGYSRGVGPEQLINNVSSIFGSGGDGNLQGTKKWREDWWDKIWDYTVHGPYFLTGKGFGVNLAKDDGFQVLAGDALRSPHNGHITILARMGVPGLALWIGIQAAFGFSMYQAFRRARHAGSLFWARIDTWILIYWMAMLINMAFDVYLEGPQGGIWFWTLIGLGLGALRLQSSSLSEPEPTGVR